ncbi:MAG: hypothetical protein E7554_02720 [Ruminococcaceae bacterium]|nr:hypothetical protein [Oscillospiraceae bacterium]
MARLNSSVFSLFLSMIIKVNSGTSIFPRAAPLSKNQSRRQHSGAASIFVRVLLLAAHYGTEGKNTDTTAEQMITDRKLLNTSMP